MRAFLDSFQRRWLDQLDDQTIDKAIKALAALIFLTAVGFGSYYYFDRYAVSSQPLVDREAKRLEDMVRKDPTNIGVRIGLANFYIEKGETDAAIEQLQQVLKLDDSNAGALISLGDAYMQKKEYAKAVESYSKVVAASANSPLRNIDQTLQGVLFDLGRAYVNLGRWDDAIATLKDAANINQNDADTMYVLGTAYEGKGNWDDAIAAFSQAAAFVPDYKDPYQGLVECYQKKGYQDMVQWAKGMVAITSGSNDEAIGIFQNLLKTRPTMFEAQAGLGMAYERKKDNSKAIEAYKKAYELNPSYRMAKDGLVRLGALNPD